MTSKNVLVAGAGIAGLTTAYWLKKHGFTPTVVERATEIRDGGYKVDIRGAAVDVIRRMGLLDEVRRRATEVREATFVDRTGRKVAEMDADLFGGRSGADVEILRGDLARLLFDQLDGVEFGFGDSIVDIQPDGTVRFEHTPARKFDLVVGADGLRSATRRMVFGEGDVRELGYYVSIFTVPNHLGLDRAERTYVEPGRTALMYSTRGAADAKAMFLFAAPPMDYDRRDTEQQRAILAEAYAGAGWEVPRLIEAAKSADGFYFDSLSLVELDRWSRGRVVLTGDAAYCASPASGQGTSLALVGAYVLAGELASSDDPATAFARYEQEMRGFVTANQKLGPANVRGMVIAKRWQIRAQLAVLRMLPHLPGKERMAGRIAARIHRAATAITLKDY
ncbi:FAD-dependent monooxygenase [Actinocrispum wychmicini]|uniref:2-polyprenyl-6-methoxyphenol hydroxylase-like FAD-dependent oxidoreductase n=1 Tax=Actinocrispum wychmicini TaxID=1213861 RepID=A0A4R2IZ13_9PSEU|nr:FAD-dependent monooxygenase [Actinocrispum wychmicini]TCO49716.1 2-polyprenyl-6-methoxyphenol hydroxylase-like FAD-dependent oxidoreductase [Actinocrispum wychmicini]